MFFVLWALIPFTFIDCGFRVVAGGSIVRGLADKHKVARARLAFMLNNTASPAVELIPIATTYVGFNLAIITQGLKGAGLARDTSYATWLRAIPFEFFSIALIAVTLVSVFFQLRKASSAAVITGGTFGDVTSPVAGMTNMASNIARADHSAYLRYGRPYNLTAAGVAVVLFVVAGFFSQGKTS